MSVPPICLYGMLLGSPGTASFVPSIPFPVVMMELNIHAFYTSSLDKGE